MYYMACMEACMELNFILEGKRPQAPPPPTSTPVGGGGHRVETCVLSLA